MFDFRAPGLFRNDHLRYRRLWIALGILLIIGVTLASVVNVPAVVKEVMFNDKILHIVVYAGLMGWFAQIFRHDLTRLILVVSFMVMGVGIEFMQALTPTRQFEVLDMIANCSGVLLAWAMSYTWAGDILVRFEALVSPVAVDCPQD